MFAKIATLVMLISCSALPLVYTQEGIELHPITSEETVLAVVDVQPSSAAKAGELSEAIKIFNQVLWDDLSFSGYFKMAGKSFNPPQPILRPQDVNYDSWNSPPLPVRVSFMTAGTLDIKDGEITAKMRIYDMKQRAPGFGKEISGPANQIRFIAHRWADEVVSQLTAGASKGIARTKIAFASRKGNAKDIQIVDYDGFNLQTFIQNGVINSFPNWSPDNSKLAFMSFKTGKPEINIYSVATGARIKFPEFDSMALSPAFSPNGKEIAFSLRSLRGDSDIFISNVDGSNRRNITNNPAIDGAPTWSPTGRQLAFESERDGKGRQIFVCDSDGSNVRKIVKEGGEADSPAWSPDGKWIVFHWQPRMTGKFDIFIADVATMKIHQLTSGGGSNEAPTWAPDSRHIAFQSSRTGTNQIYIMLLDGSELRMITHQGNNTSPAWGGYR
jgi:TolB protein